jgi:CheY-like chemotaxis protein
VPRLLVVDDDPQQLEIRKLLLEAAGHQVHTASTAAEAMGLLPELRPDVLLMDLRLPKLKDGLSLIRAAAEARASSKILVLSGWGEELADLPEQQLVTQVLAKPVRQEHLLQAIREALA